MCGYEGEQADLRRYRDGYLRAKKATFRSFRQKINFQSNSQDWELQSVAKKHKMAFEYEVYGKIISRESNAKLMEGLVGNDTSKELVPRSSRSVVAQLLGLAPLPMEPKPAKGAISGRPPINGHSISEKKSLYDLKLSPKALESSTWPLAQLESVSRPSWQHEVDNNDGINSFHPACSDFKKAQLHLVKKNTDDSQQLKSCRTSRSLALESAGQVTQKEIQTFRNLKKTNLSHSNDLCISPRVSLRGFENSEQMVEAINFLQSNKDFFSKFLQEPNSLLVRHLQKRNLYTEACSHLNGSQNYRLTYLLDSSGEEEQGQDFIKPKESLGTDCPAQQRRNETSSSSRQKSKGRKPRLCDEHLLVNESEKDQYGKTSSKGRQAPTQIVLLKPGKNQIQLTPSSSNCSPYQVPSKDATEVVEDNSQEVLGLLKSRLRRVHGRAKAHEIGHPSQRDWTNDGKDCKASREKAQEIARQVRDTIRENIKTKSGRSATNQGESVKQGERVNLEMSTVDKSPSWDNNNVSSTISSTLVKQTRCSEAKIVLRGKEYRKGDLEKAATMKQPQSQRWQHPMLSIEDANLFNPCDQGSSQLKIPQPMPVQNRANLNRLNGLNRSQTHHLHGLNRNAKTYHSEKRSGTASSLKGLEDYERDSNGSANRYCREIQQKRTGASTKQARYAERLGQFLLETNKTKVDVAVESLLSRDRRLSSTLKGVVTKKMLNQTRQGGDGSLKQVVPTVAPEENRNVSTSFNSVPLSTEYNAFLEQAFTARNESYFASCRQNGDSNLVLTESNLMGDAKYDKLEAHHQSWQLGSVTNHNFENQRLGEGPQQFEDETEGKCEVLRRVVSRNPSAIEKRAYFVNFQEGKTEQKGGAEKRANPDTFEEAGLKLQELRSRLQLLKSEIQDKPEIGLEKPQKEATTEEAAFVAHPNSEKPSACHNSCEPAAQYSDVRDIQIPDCSVTNNRTLLDLNDYSPRSATSPTSAELESVSTSVQHGADKSIGAAQLPRFSTKEMGISYIHDLLNSSGLIGGGCSDVFDDLSKWHTHNEPLYPQLFVKLEDSYKDRGVSDGKYFNDTCTRRLLFDCVNEILLKMLGRYQDSCSWGMTYKATNSMPTKENLSRLVCMEVSMLPRPEEYTTEQLVAQDINQEGFGRDLPQESKALVVKLETAILNDLIEEVIVGR